jgi:HlyD family secretion protein
MARISTVTAAGALDFAPAILRAQHANEANAQRLRLEQEAGKQAYRRELLELKAPQAGIVKDLATHTPGSVVSPGAILLTLVPAHDPVKAEVWVTNEDAGFVEVNQPVKIKLAAFPFNKYGMLNGRVETIWAAAR